MLDRLAEGPGGGEQFAYSSRSTERWAGHIVMADLGKSGDETKKILAAWKASQLITVEKYLSPERREEIPGLQVNAGKLAEMRATSATSESENS